MDVFRIETRSGTRFEKSLLGQNLYSFGLQSFQFIKRFLRSIVRHFGPKFGYGRPRSYGCAVMEELEDEGVDIGTSLGWKVLTT